MKKFVEAETCKFCNQSLSNNVILQSTVDTGEFHNPNSRSCVESAPQKTATSIFKKKPAMLLAGFVFRL
jgi:hypothetical protein